MFVKLRQLMELLSRFTEIDDVTNPAQLMKLLQTIVDAAELIGLSPHIVAMISGAIENENVFKVVHSIVLFIHGILPQPQLMAACCPDDGDTAGLMANNGELTLTTQDGEEITVDAATAVNWITLISQAIALYQWIRERFPRQLMITSVHNE